MSLHEIWSTRDGSETVLVEATSPDHDFLTRDGRGRRMVRRVDFAASETDARAFYYRWLSRRVDHESSLFKYDRFEDCPDAFRKHTQQPDGYLQRAEWSERKARTHDQVRCPTCGFWVIWKRRQKPTARSS